ncbi:MAG: class I SAM-dependent methyltransferase [Nitrospinota bacterium]
MSSNEDQFLPTSCPLCDGSEYALIGKEDDLNIVQCKKCTLLYINPRKLTAGKFESSINGSMNKYGAILRGEKPHQRDPNYREHYRDLRLFKKPGKLLDIGTQLGFFGRFAREYGWDFKGIEPNPTRGELARKFFNLQIATGFLDDAQFDENSFDAVTMVDVFEHVWEPVEMLKSIRRFIKDDGMILIKVPNGAYNHWKWKWFEKFKIKRECWDSDEHVVHYSRDTLGKMLEKAGYEPLQWFVARPIQSKAYGMTQLKSLTDPSYFFTEFVKMAIFRVGQGYNKVSGKYLHILPDIKVVARPKKNNPSPVNISQKFSEKEFQSL